MKSWHWIIGGFTWLVFVVGITVLVPMYDHQKPHTIYADGKVFKVYYSDSYPDNFLNPALKDSQGRRPVGMTFCEDKTHHVNSIQVDPNEDFTELQDTLWHEAKHAANRCTTLTGHWTDNPDFDYDNLYEFETAEELHLLRNNPRLDRFITARPYPWQK